MLHHYLYLSQIFKLSALIFYSPSGEFYALALVTTGINQKKRVGQRALPKASPAKTLSSCAKGLNFKVTPLEKLEFFKKVAVIPQFASLTARAAREFYPQPLNLSLHTSASEKSGWMLSPFGTHLIQIRKILPLFASYSYPQFSQV